MLQSLYNCRLRQKSVIIRKSDLKNLEPSHILHIGDDVVNDYQAPKCLGWNSLLLNRAKTSLEYFKNVPAQDICRDFRDVEAVIETRFRKT